MLNPLTHSANADDMARYKVEPYVVAADVYSAAAHVGRGGWTWYTGSASWMYRVGLEQLLGFTKSGNTLAMNPCVPTDWPEYSVVYRFGATEYAISVVDPTGVQQRGAMIEIDGVRQPTDTIPLVDDGRRRIVVVSPAR